MREQLFALFGILGTKLRATILLTPIVVALALFLAEITAGKLLVLTFFASLSIWGFLLTVRILQYMAQESH